MEHPGQAIKYLERCIIFILSNGSLLDQAKLHYLYSKCLNLLDKKKSKYCTVFKKIYLYFYLKCFPNFD